MANGVEQQISAQRQQISAARSQLQSQLEQQKNISQAQLRGVERTRVQKNALSERAKRKSEKELLGKSVGEVSQFESEFEAEVASKAPQYGKAEFVEKEYKKAEESINQKISNVDLQIAQKEERLKQAQQIGDSEAVERYEDDVEILNARKIGYQKALSGDKATVIQNVNTGYAEELASYEEQKKYSSIQQLEQIKEMGFTSRVEYIKAKPLLEKLSKGNLSVSELSKLPSKIQSQVSVIDVPAEVKTIEPSQVKVPSSAGVYQNVITGQRMSARTAPSSAYIKVNEQTDKFVSRLSSNKFKTITSPLVYGKAPTISEKYKRDIARGGYVKGSLSFVGGLGSSYIDKLQQLAYKRGDKSAYYQQTAFQNVPQVAATKGVYFVPVLGASLLVAGGVEDLATKSGRARLKETEKYLTEVKGYNPVVSKTIAYGQPVAEVSLGALGLRGEFGQVKAMREAQLLENAKTRISGARVQTNKGGVDIIYGYKKTSPSSIDRNILRIKPTEQVTKIRQPFYFSGEKRVVLEGGRGITITKTGEKLRTSIFDISGVGKTTEGTLKYGRNGIKVDTGMQSGAGYLNIKERLATEGVLRKNVNSLTGEVSYTYKGKAIKSDKSLRKLFIGGSSEEKNIIKTISGEPNKIRMNLETGETKIRAKPEAYGYIKKLEMSSPENMFFSGGSSLKTQGGSSAYVQTAVKEASKISSSPKSESILKSSSGAGVFPSSQLQKTEVKQEVKTQTKQETLQIIKPSVQEKTSTKIRTIELLKPETREKQITKTRQVQTPVIKPLEVIKFRPVSTTKQIQEPKQTQRPRQTTTTIQPPKTEQKIPVPPVILSPVKTGKTNKVQKIINDTFGSFEAFGKRFGKDVSLGKFGTSREASGVLSKFLTGTLGASGFLKATGKKIRAEETGLLSNPEFTKSKVSQFLVVEKKSKRLRKGTTSKEISFFRKSGKKKKR